jgi:hypothetical protein
METIYPAVQVMTLTGPPGLQLGRIFPACDVTYMALSQ